MPRARGHVDSMQYRQIDHPSEARISVRGPTMAALAVAAGEALAMLESGGDLPAPEGQRRVVEISARDRAALLVDWLNELIFLAESECWLPVEFQILDSADGRLRARIGGAPLPHAPSFVKAATLHGATVTERDGQLEAMLLLDI